MDLETMDRREMLLKEILRLDSIQTDVETAIKLDPQ